MFLSISDNEVDDCLECYKIVVNGEDRRYICQYCEAEYTDAKSMRSHILNEHTDTERECIATNDNIVRVHNYFEVAPGFNIRLDKMLSYICHVCSKEYPNENSLKLHKKNYHTPKKCPDCDLKFTRRNLRMHQHEAHGVQIPTCGVCGYKNWVRAKVIVHQRKVHMNEKNVSCDQCDMKFFDRISLGRHKIAHGTDRKFECSYCHKKYPRLNTLRLHEKIHTKVKDKVCSICGQGFVQKASLNYHMKKYHPEAC